MNAEMLKTELYKLYARKVTWVSAGVFLALFLALQMQFPNMVGVQYTLEPLRAELSKAVENEALHAFVRERDYACGADELLPFLPDAVSLYLAQYSGSARVCQSLRSDLARAVNGFFERTDARAAYLSQLAGYSAADTPTQARAKRKLLEIYQSTPVRMELNLETSANNLIDVNHAAVFPGLLMLVVLVGLSGIYADEYTCGMQAALLTARHGRRGVFFSKLTAAGLFVGSVVLLMEGFALTVSAVCHRAPGTPLSAASTSGMALATYGGTVYGFCLRQAAGTLLAALTLGSVVLCLSARSKNALVPFFAAGAFYGATALCAHAVPLPAYASTLWSLPGELSLFMLQTQVELVAPGRCTVVFGVPVPTLAVNALWNTALMALCLFLCWRGYTRGEVKG